MNYDILASSEKVQKTIEALKGRNIEARFIETKEQVLEELKKIIPAGVSVMTGGSTTLDQIGFTDLLKSGQHPWNNLKNEILAEKDPEKQNRLRKESVLADYFLGSVHAITETGECIIASASGSQLPSYSFTSDHVIWVCGTQKIVSDLNAGFKRIEEYVYPLEDERMKKLGYPGSNISKILIIRKETMPQRKIILLFVNEKLGF